MLKNDLIKKLTLFSIFVTSHPGKEAITTEILLSISRTRGNRSIKLGKNIIRETFFLKNNAKNEMGRLAPNLFLFFKKAWYEVKASGLQFYFNISR